MSALIVLIVLIVVFGLYVVAIYNGLIKRRLHTEEAWAGMDVQLKRRYDMIPNLVEIVKGYAKHESDVFTRVTEARANAISAGNVKDQAVAENMLTGALKSVFAVAENYPDLKASANFAKLQEEYSIVEDAIQGARRLYNSAVKSFNAKVQMFPSNVIAGMFKFEEKDFFEIENKKERENIKIKM